MQGSGAVKPKHQLPWRGAVITSSINDFFFPPALQTSKIHSWNNWWGQLMKHTFHYSLLCLTWTFQHKQSVLNITIGSGPWYSDSMLQQDYCLFLIYAKSGTQHRLIGGAGIQDSSDYKKCPWPAKRVSTGLLLWRKNSICRIVDAVVRNIYWC